MSSHYGTQAYYQTTALPITMSTKSQNYYTTGSRSGYAVSPPESSDSLSSNPGVTPSYRATYSATPSYAGSEYDSRNSASGIDLQEYVQDRFSAMTFNPLPLDRSLATQAQTSGTLNAKHREIQDLQAKAQARLAKSRARYAEGIQDAKEVKRDLEYTQKRVSTLKTKASRKHPHEHKKARERYPSPEY